MRGNIAPDTGQENAQALYLREKKKLGGFQLAIVLELQMPWGKCGAKTSDN